MRFMVLVKATPTTEAGVMPTAAQLSEMGKFNQALIDAGVLLDASGLKPTAHAARVQYRGATQRVIDGPFAEAKELVAGYWIWQCTSMAEALEWARRCPNPAFDGDGELEIRPLFEMSDFPDVPPEVARMAAEAAERKG
mgnify:CR=1 FL=1